MNKEQLLAMVDHTLLKQEATWAQIRGLCDDAVTFHTASVCIPPSFVKQAKDYVQDKLSICTVIGFPNGYSTTEVKVFETEDAIRSGADEIDMVINIGLLKQGDTAGLFDEIKRIKNACGEHILKVIIETCLLTEEEKISMCDIVTRAGADYIKTSTGFSTGGATKEDVALMASHVGDGVKVKAAGGIASWEEAEEMRQNGAERLGTSRLVKLSKNI